MMTAEVGFDITKPDPARRYNYWLGGRDNFAIDRESGDQIAEAFPPVAVAARENRAFLKRAVATLAGEGIDQFLDIGAGLPSADNTHEVAQRINPAAHVVYVDNSPLVLVHARALLTAEPGAHPTTVVEADLRDPAGILNHPDVRADLDWTRPLGLLLIAVLHFLGEDDRPHDIVAQLVDALPSGSWLALTNVSTDLLSPEWRERFDKINAQAGIPVYSRDYDEMARFFTGLDVADPGIVSVQRWRPEPGHGALLDDTDIGIYGAIARKP
jgi:S-adenosyl methyltransferase